MAFPNPLLALFFYFSGGNRKPRSFCGARTTGLGGDDKTTREKWLPVIIVIVIKIWEIVETQLEALSDEEEAV